MPAPKPALDFEALLAADAEGAKREVKDAHGGRRVPDMAKAVKVDPKVLLLIKRALKLADDNDHVGAARAALKAVDLAPELALANQTMGLCLERMGRLSQSIDFYERAMRFDPHDAGVYYNLGMVAWKLDMLDGAERLYRVALNMDPGSAEATINLAGVLRDLGRFSDSIELLRAAIYVDPDNPLYWNSLGTTLLDANDPEQAMTFYRETIRLAPDFARGWHNLGYAQALCGDAEASVASSDVALENPKSPGDRTEMLYARAQSLLGAGRFVEGWRDYAVRLEKDYASGTRYLAKQPLWDASTSIAGKRVLMIGEQGVGDEVLFLNVVGDMIDEIGPEGLLTIACENRLVPLVQRSFPAARVVFHGTTRREGVTFRGLPEFDWSTVDCWTPMATPLARYRVALEQFPDAPSYLDPDPERVAEFRATLDALPAGPKVGLCWKSKLMNSKRSKYFSPFEDWKHVLRTPGAVFVNLQYGDVSEELPRALAEHGATIHEIPGLDLMQDLEGVAALGAALDLSVGPLNASTNLAAAVGCPTWFVALKTDWVLMGARHAPWYPASRAFWPERYGDWAGVMKEVAANLAQFEPIRRAA